MSASRSAFFACPQCHYQYRFARTRIVGLATNSGAHLSFVLFEMRDDKFNLFALLVIVGGLSGLLFTLLVMIASYITTFFISVFESPSYYHPFYSNPFEVAQDLVTAAFRVMKDGEMASILEDNIRQRSTTTSTPGAPPPVPRPRSGIIVRFIQRFILGLPLVGASSLVHLLLSVQYLAPVQWLARYRGSRSRRNDGSRDIAALIVIGLLVVGALRFVLYYTILSQKTCSG
jgi:hypothetical protein